MYVRVFHIFALALFFLLQAVAPLLHAHIGRPHTGGIHMHIALPASLDASKALRVQSVRLADSPAIEVGDASKHRDAAALDTPAPISTGRALPAPFVIARDEKRVLSHPLAFQLSSRFILPPAQAPPNNAG
jgi:hypothetical protein